MNPPNKMSIIVSLYDNCVSCNENLDAYDKDHKKIEIDTTLVQKEFDRQKADYDSKQYQRDRQYPELGEQFDLLFKDINEGTLDKTGGFYTAIKAVKDAHPKPSE